MKGSLFERVLDPRAGLVLVGVLLLAEGFGAISDGHAAMVLGAWAAVAAARLIHEEAAGEAEWLRFGLAALTVAAMLVPLGATLVPGEAVFHADAHEGQHFTLPDALRGPVRILVHGRIVGAGNGVIEYRLDGLEAPVGGKLERGSGLAKIGRRRVPQSHTRDTELVSGSVGNDHELVVGLARGAIDGPLSLSFFAERWPLRNQLLAALALLGLGALVCWRRSRWQMLLPACATAACFGMFAYRWLAPGSDFRPEIGALLVAIGCGLAVHVAVRWVEKRLGHEIPP